MAEDRYRLAPIRDARARDERVRRGELAAAAGDAHHTEARLGAALARTQAARAALAAAIVTRDAPTARAVALAERFIARKRRDLADAIAQELRVEAAHDSQLASLDRARRTLARARADREVIDRHFARWRETQRKLAERRED